ncbi:alpha/beta hydrolase [Nocardioides panacisoli]|uniref:Alpha/beta hydrolase n=1 Tax=Nocardioides panacisoli TaxID=627624 RepID=A0ABP7IV38_9ACTN
MKTLSALLLTLALSLTHAPAGHAADPAPRPYSPVADLANMTAAYGRIVGPGGQLRNPAYLPALVQQSNKVTTAQLLQQAAEPNRLALTPAVLVPGWNVGNPLRAGWDGTRGRTKQVAFLNRFGAQLRGTLYAPLPDARDPYTGARLSAPYPGVVITPGSVGGSQGMYQWLAEDLAERGYLVLLYDVQGEGTSETLPHMSGSAFPYCNPFAPPAGDPELGTQQMTGCPGVPFQQLSNFTTGTEDAVDFFTGAANPWLDLWDQSPLDHPTAPGRTTKLAIIGHSMGAFAVSQVQEYDDRVATVVALDKLAAPKGMAPYDQGTIEPEVPALGVQSEYGFTVTPWQLSGGSSIVPGGGAPDPMRERETGFDAWRASGEDSMLVVPRASTHLEYTDIPLVLPASRYGQDLASVYVQRWLDRYLRDGSQGALLASSLRYLEPRGHGRWQPITLRRDPLLSGRYCSAYSLGSGESHQEDLDWTGVGC